MLYTLYHNYTYIYIYMYIVYCLHTLYRVLCTVYCKPNRPNLNQILSDMYCILYQDNVYTVHRILYTVCCIPNIMYLLIYTVYALRYCTRYIVSNGNIYIYIYICICMYIDLLLLAVYCITCSVWSTTAKCIAHNACSPLFVDRQHPSDAAAGNSQPRR